MGWIRQRSLIRQRDSQPIIENLRTDLMRLRTDASVLLPKSPLGRAIDYTLALWPKLGTFIAHGEVEIDTNLTENAIRPTAVGKKNWLFVGGEGTGQTSAILYTMIESVRSHGHEPHAYLRNVLERLPAMKSSEIDQLLPRKWEPVGQPAILNQVA